MRRNALAWSCVMWLSCLACGDSSNDGGSGDGDGSPNQNDKPPTHLDGSPAAGNPDGKCDVPAEGAAEDTSAPRTVVGSGSAETCTGDAFVEAVAKGGVIAFDCGPDPVTITLSRTAKIVNDTGPKIVVDGGGKVTLSGGGKVRIVYQNTCDEAQKWTTSHCNDQDHPALTLQNISLIDGNSRGEDEETAGGGALFVRGGQLKLVNTRFFGNVTDETGPDVGGASVRVFDMFEDRPVHVVRSTFGGADGYGNAGSNGSGLSSIGVSWKVYNSLFSHNRAEGHGANPAKAGTPGGGSGGAIYCDGNDFTLELCGTLIEDNTANEGGGAIFFVSNDRSGKLVIRDSVLRRNPSAGFETEGYPGIFYLGDGDPEVSGSTLSP